MCGIKGPSYDVHLVDLGLTSCRPCHKYCMGWVSCVECGWWDNTKHMAKEDLEEMSYNESGFCDGCLEKKRAERVARMERERADREESVRTYKRLYLNGGQEETVPCRKRKKTRAKQEEREDIQTLNKADRPYIPPHQRTVLTKLNVTTAADEATRITIAP